MTHLISTNEFEFGVVFALAEIIDDMTQDAMQVWKEDNDDQNQFASRDHSAQSESTYWTVGNDNFEFCLRLSNHKARRCLSRVDLSINISDYIEETTDDCGEPCQCIDYESACNAAREAASSLLEKIK